MTGGEKTAWKDAAQNAATVAAAPMLVAIGFLFDSIGELRSEVVQNTTSAAVARERHITAQDALDMIREHRMSVVEPRLALVIESIEKQQRLRDDALRRELSEIKAQLEKLIQR